MQNSELKIKIINKHIIRSKTNDGEYAKQIFTIMEADDNKYENALIIDKLVLTENYKLYENYGFKNLKQFKNKRLYLQVFGIKLKTLNEAFNYFNEL